MNIIEIIKESLIYPTNNLMSLVVYIILGIIASLAIVTTVAGLFVGFTIDNIIFTSISGLLGIIVTMVIFFLIQGYMLDVLKLGIDHSNDSPKIDILRQVINGFKLFIVDIVYLVIPLIILILLTLVFAQWLAMLIGIIVFIIFAFVLAIAECRLANTENLSDALSFADTFSDLQRVGIMNVIQLIVILAVVFFVLFFITGIIGQANSYLGSVLASIVDIYILFVQKRATGLIYSS